LRVTAGAAAIVEICSRSTTKTVGVTRGESAVQQYWLRDTGRCSLFVGALLFSVAFAADMQFLEPSETAAHVGEQARVCGLVSNTKYVSHRNRRPTFLDFGEPYPNHDFTVLVWGDVREQFSYAPESLKGARICVTGTIGEFKGKPQIVVSDPAQIVRQEDV